MYGCVHSLMQYVCFFDAVHAVYLYLLGVALRGSAQSKFVSIHMQKICGLHTNMALVNDMLSRPLHQSLTPSLAPSLRYPLPINVAVGVCVGACRLMPVHTCVCCTT